MALLHSFWPVRLFRECNFPAMYVVFHRQTSKSKVTNFQQKNVIDMYAENLLQENMNKWKALIFKLSTNNTDVKNFNVQNPHLVESNVTFENLAEDELSDKIIDFVKENNAAGVLSVVQFCKENHCSLPRELMLNLINLFSKLGNKEIVHKLISLFEVLYKKEFIRLNKFEYYVAEILWYEGKYKESFDILEKLYKEKLVRREANCVMYNIIYSVLNKGEASLVNLTNFVEKLAMNYDEHYPMAILWRQLCLSDWFADQQLAKKILGNNIELRNYIQLLLPVWCARLTQCHSVDLIYRLSEVLLQYNYLSQYSTVLHCLFDYYYFQGNLKRCSAIVKSTVDLNIPLKNSYQKRYLTLLMKGNTHKGKTNTELEIPKRIKFQINLKF